MITSDCTPESGWVPFSIPNPPLTHEQIPTFHRHISDKQRVLEDAVVSCLAQFGIGSQDPEELRRRCVIVHKMNSRIESLHVDGIMRLEWGYLNPIFPNTWTVRTVEPPQG